MQHPQTGFLYYSFDSTNIDAFGGNIDEFDEFDYTDDAPLPPKRYQSGTRSKKSLDVREAFIRDVFGALSPELTRSVMKDLTCIIPGCSGTISMYSKYCRTCYDEQKRFANRYVSCKTTGCPRTVAFSGYCRACNNARPKSAGPKQKRHKLVPDNAGELYTATTLTTDPR